MSQCYNLQLTHVLPYKLRRRFLFANLWQKQKTLEVYDEGKIIIDRIAQQTFAINLCDVLGAYRGHITTTMMDPKNVILCEVLS